MQWWTKQQFKFGSASTRLALVEKLAFSDDPSAVGALILALKCKETNIRCTAAKALGRFRGRQVVSSLIGMLRDPAALVRANAAETLSHLDDPGAVEKLEVLLQDPDSVVRSIVARGLHRLGWQPGSDAQRVQQILALGNLEQLAALGTAGIAPLLESLRSGPPNRQLTAVKTLGKFKGDPRVRPAMLEALRKSTPLVRIAALGVLERMADPITYPEVEQMLKDSSAAVRTAAVEAAFRCGGSRAVPALAEALSDTHWEVRLGAATVLGELRDRSVVDSLCKLIQDPDRDVRERVIKSLGKINDRRAVPALVIALLDVESVVRNVATATLNRIDHRWHEDKAVLEVLPQIQRALHSPDYWVGYCAGKLLEKLGVDVKSLTKDIPKVAPAIMEEPPVHPAYPVLADLLFDRDRSFRLGAAEALGRLREPKAKVILTECLKDSDELVRQAVTAALAAQN